MKEDCRCAASKHIRSNQFVSLMLIITIDKAFCHYFVDLPFAFSTFRGQELEICESHAERNEDRGELCRACGVCGALSCAMKQHDYRWNLDSRPNFEKERKTILSTNEEKRRFQRDMYKHYRREYLAGLTTKWEAKSVERLEEGMEMSRLVLLRRLDAEEGLVRCRSAMDRHELSATMRAQREIDREERRKVLEELREWDRRLAEREKRAEEDDGGSGSSGSGRGGSVSSRGSMRSFLLERSSVGGTVAVAIGRSDNVRATGSDNAGIAATVVEGDDGEQERRGVRCRREEEGEDVAPFSGGGGGDDDEDSSTLSGILDC